MLFVYASEEERKRVGPKKNHQSSRGTFIGRWCFWFVLIVDWWYSCIEKRGENNHKQKFDVFENQIQKYAIIWFVSLHVKIFHYKQKFNVKILLHIILLILLFILRTLSYMHCKYHFLSIHSYYYKTVTKIKHSMNRWNPLNW